MGMEIALYVLAGALSPLVFIEVRRHVRRAKASRQRQVEMSGLAQQAFTKLEEASVTLTEFKSGRTSVRLALESGDMGRLRAYANLIGEANLYAISAAVSVVKKAQEYGIAGSLSPETLTAAQVSAFFEVVDWLDPLGECLKLLGAESTKIAMFAMTNVEDADLIISIAQRGVCNLADVRAVLDDMKSLPVSLLSEGVL